MGTDNEDLLRAILTEEFHFDIGKTLTLRFILLAHRSIAHPLCQYKLRHLPMVI